MLAPWAKEEMATVDLNDERLNRRLAMVLSDLGERPTTSIPAACGGHAEMTAAYRLFDNPKVTHAEVLEPHFQRTRERMAEQEVVLLVQDTTECDVTRPEQQVTGAGPMDCLSRRGAYVH
ncbi:MAG: IS4/Tn5 family transposase DNA-binding protein, partial [Pirellulales bacterium]